MPAISPILEAKAVHKTYGKGPGAYEALRGVSLAVAPGEAVAILGKSGSGKSTLMHLLAGLDKPTTGTITYAGQPLGQMREKAMAGFRSRHVGFIFQQFFLQPTLSVQENVVLPLKIAGLSRRERDQKAAAALKKVGLTDWAGHRATDLSGGQKQRAAIARAIVSKPDIIFADEPTGNLDSETGQSVMKALFELQKTEGITLVIVTHDLDLARLCNRHVRIADGRLSK
jgi:putative ABC transport system ATP-binding protein